MSVYSQTHSQVCMREPSHGRAEVQVTEMLVT